MHEQGAADPAEDLIRVSRALKESEARLAQSETHFRALSEALPQIVWSTDADGDVDYCNQRWYEYTGGQPGFSEGWSWKTAVHPEDLAHALESWQKARETGAPFQYESRLRRHDGLYRWFLVSGWPSRDAGGKVVRWFGSNTDIHDIKTAEAALRESRDRMTWVLDKTGVGTWFNTLPLGRLNWDIQTRQLFFISPEAEPTIELFYSRLHPADREPTRLEVERAIKNHMLYAIEHRAVNPDTGRIRWIRSIGQATYALDGTPVRFDGVNFDITWRKEAEEELRRLNENLEKRVAERTCELRQKSDQLRALATQLSLAEQKERKRLAQILHDHIQQLIVAARIQFEFISQVRNPAQMQEALRLGTSILDEALEASRSLAIDLSPPVLHEIGLLAALQWLADRMKDQHHFTINIQADNDAEPATEELRFLLFDCARELLLNAVKHSCAKEADIKIERAEHEYISLQVRDAGRGFESGCISGDPAKTTLGLFNIQQRISQFRGRMEVEAAPGRGTKITLTVPLGAAASSTSENDSEMPVWGNTQRFPADYKSGLCRVLIVDDHEMVREGLARLLLLDEGIDIVGKAVDGPQAIELADDLKPDVVLMDVTLGEMSGTETTRRILANNPQIKVLGLSMHTDKSVIEAMIQAGAVGYLTKNCTREELLEAIQSYR